MNQTNNNSYKVSSDPHHWKEQISQKFTNYDLNKQYSYDEILFILDEQSPTGKCDRDIARQLFDQSINANNKSTLNQIIFKFIENVQTSRLCLTREQTGQSLLEQRLRSLKGSKKTYIYLKLIQITAYARHSATPSLSYKIWPSDIPPVTVINSLNPILNHQYTLELETDSFSIIFYESGIKIAEWSWPDNIESNRQGEYHRNIMTENISFELKLNYKPINSHPKKKQLEENLKVIKTKRELQTAALYKLQNFDPFVSNYKNVRRSVASPQFEKVKTGGMWKFSERMLACLPFLSGHVRNLYYALICLIIIESLAAIWWPMEFLDITVAFGAIGLLYDRSQNDLGMPFLIIILALMILIVKSIWGIVAYNNGGFFIIALLIIAVILKVVCIFLAWIVTIRSEQVPLQRHLAFYEGIDRHNSNGINARAEDKTY